MGKNGWLGQSTTGAGFATLIATVGSVATGTLSWQHAVPLVVGGLVGLIWPENTGMQATASTAAASLQNLIEIYKAGLNTQGQAGSANSNSSTAETSS